MYDVICLRRCLSRRRCATFFASRSISFIAHVSRSETLHTGEFPGSGTVGNGCGLEQMRFLKPGDVIELEVEHIGVLRNPACCAIALQHATFPTRSQSSAARDR